MDILNHTDIDKYRQLDTAELINQLNRAIVTTEIVALVETVVAKKTNEAIAPLIQLLHHHNPNISTAAVEGLVKLAPNSVEPLITAFQSCKDHGVQAYIVQALARIGDPRALDLLIEVVGVEVANHCQGNVRRVAARGLGKIGKINNLNTRNKAVEKLTWALFKAEDWALRYAAVVSLEEIATELTTSTLQEALIQELDNVIQLRIKTALDN